MTNQPLTIGIYEAWLLRDPVRYLVDYGHEVLNIDSINQHEVDLILHPCAHQWDDRMWDYLPAALVAGRKRRRARLAEAA